MISQQTTLQTISKHSNLTPDLTSPQGLRCYIQEADVIFRNPKSGSVPALTELITPEQRAMLVEDVLPKELRDDEKTMWYLDKLNELGSSSMIPIEPYLSNKKNIVHKCIVCGYEAVVKPGNAEFNARKERRGCDGCNHRNGTSLEDAQRLFRYKRPDLMPLSGYQKKTDQILIRCLECGHEWETQPHYVLLDGPGRSGCPECSNNGQNRKTQEQFVEEVRTANPDIEVLGQYVNSKTKILVRHTSCGHEWEVPPPGLLIQHGCPKCHNNMKKPKGKRKTQQEFLDEMKEIHPDIEVLGEYVTNKTKIKVKHLPCGKEFEITPDSLLRGRGCSFCNRRQSTINSRKTHTQFIEEIRERHPDIEILSEYINSKTKVRAMHTPCRHEWMVQPNKLLAGRGCPKCNKPQKTHEEYLRELAENGIEYIPQAEYAGVDTKIPHLCPECNTAWDISPYNILLGYGCPRCRSNRQSYEEVMADLKEIAPTVTIIDEYSGKNTNALFQCLECGNKWRTNPYEVLHGKGCPKCARQQSFPEISVYYFLNRDLSYSVLLNPQISIPHLKIGFEADIFIPDLKLFVEYDGFYWHKDEKVDKRYMNREKAIYTAGYSCLHIIEYAAPNKHARPWMIDQPLFVEAKNHKSNSDELDRCITALEAQLGIETQNNVDCLSDKRLIEEAYKQAPRHKITILENGDMKVEE